MLFTVLSQIEIWVGPIPLMGGSTAGSRWNLASFVGVISIGLALRLRHPLLALVLAMGPMALHWPAQFLPAKINPNLFEIFLAEVFIVYSTSAHTSGRRTLVAAGLVAAIQLLAYGPYLPGGALSQAFGEWVFYSIAWALGKTVLQRERRGDRLEARTAELERAITERTAAVAYHDSPNVGPGILPFATVVEIVGPPGDPSTARTSP